jgi:DNA polymerase-3 subunit epsilon
MTPAEPASGAIATEPRARLRLRQPIVWIDLETTGLSIETDLIVEISVLKEWPDGRLEERTRRVNPGIAIPPEATAVHGIADEDVRDEPRFAQLARGFADFLADSDLGGFGVHRFDLPLLQKEFQRAGVAFSLDGRAILDAQEVYHWREPRDLAAAYRFYLGEELAGAHGAHADAKAARAVLFAQLDRYPDLPEASDALDGRLRAERARRFPAKYERRGDDLVLKFGKHSGRTLSDLAASEPDYLRWMLQKEFPSELHEAVRRALDATASDGA